MTFFDLLARGGAANCRHDSTDPFVHDSVTGRGRSKRSGQARARPADRRIRKTQVLLVLPGNSPRSRAFPPPLREADPAICGRFGACQPGEHGRRRCRPSSQACPATSAPPSSRACGATATPSAASPARASGWRRAGVALDDLVLGDATTGAGAGRGAGRRRRRLLPDPLDGGAGGRLRRRRAPPGRGLRAGRGGGRRRAPDRLPRRAAARRRAAFAPPRVAARGRGGAAGGGAGVGRAARLDRGRGALALVPLPRAADRAPAGARAARLAREPHAAGRRPRRARVPRRRGDARAPSTPAAPGTSAGPTS